MNRILWQATSLFRTRAVAAFAALLVAACAGDDDGVSRGSGGGEVAEWAVTPEPELQIGVVEGDPDYQFHTLISAMRLPDGRVAALNAGSHELRIYGADGRLLARSGRRGKGPGEFQVPLRLYLLGDTIGVYDVGLARMSLHDAGDGRFIAARELPIAPRTFALDEWLYDRSWIDGPPLGRGRAPIVAALARLPAPDTVDAFRYIRVTSFGHLWVRQPAALGSATRTWHVHDIEGNAIARVDVPAVLEIFDIGADYLLGRARDSLDVEYLRLHRLDTRGTALSPYAFTGDTVVAAALPNDSTEAARRLLVGALRMLNGLQEVYYSNPVSQYRYADDHRKLEGYEEPEGVAVRIVNAHERGWTAVAVHRATGMMCGTTYGLTPPAGWTSGIAACQD